MSKVMFVATVVQKHINVFHLPYLNMFKQKNWETIVCAKNDFTDKSACNIPHCDKYYDIAFSRNPFSFKNFISYKNLKKIINIENPDIIHCHTPVAGILTRLAALRTRKHGIKVMYTAHGFHFYKGAPLLNWLIYYPVEKLCSYFTDVLITINNEDYSLAKRKMRAKQVVYIPGVGIDTQRFNNIITDKEITKQKLALLPDKKVLISVGELNKNKNHETVIRAIADLKDVYYIIAGKGELQEYLQNLIDALDMTERVKLLGFRSDISELCRASDVFVFPSFREGLPLSVMEAMASGLPIVCSRVRGNIDLVDENGGMLFDPNSVEDCKNAITELLNKDLEAMGNYNLEKIKEFGIEKINERMSEIYSY